MAITNPNDLDQLNVNTIRFLAVDAVNKANSGHPFWEERLVAFMKAESAPNADSLALVGELATSGRYVLATLNNESKEAIEHRIETLRDNFTMFLSRANWASRGRTKTSTRWRSISPSTDPRNVSLSLTGS